MKLTVFLLIFGSFIYLCKFVTVVSEKVQLTTNGSFIIGCKLETEINKFPFIVFWNIPYAEPPKQTLRFKAPKPRPLTLNNTIHDFSVNFHEECLQLDPDDCLYLTIYVPEQSAIVNSLPVIVWLHEQSCCHAPDFLLEENIIVVQVLYRDDIFGFLNTGDDFAVGNMGAKDVVAALRWLRDNIIYFNGDPNRVTVYGSGDSAAIVASLILSYSAEDLFARVIIGSGSALVPEQYNNNQDGTAHKLYKRLTNNHDNFMRDKFYDLLMSISSESLFKNSNSLYDSTEVRDRQRLIKSFGLSKENSRVNYFMNKHPLDVYKEEISQNNIDVMMGYTNLEAFYKLKPLIKDRNILNCLNHNFQYVLPFEGSSYEYGSEIYREIHNRIKEFYFRNGNINRRGLRRYAKYMSDQVIYPIIRQARLHAEASGRNVYLYRFSFNGAFNIQWRASVQNLTKADATCGDEICYIFKCKCINDEYNEHNLSEEKQFVRNIVQLWANFVKYGDPTPQQHNKWEPMDPFSDQLRVYNLDRIMEMTLAPETKRFEFWDKLRIEFFDEKNKEIPRHHEL